MEEKSLGPVRFIPGLNKGRYPCCNSIYIEGVEILVDPASDRERLKKLRDERAVEKIWLTHFHEDHFAHLDLFDDRPLWISEEDAPFLASLEVYLDSTWYELNDEELLWWKSKLTDEFHFKPRTPAGFLRGGDRITKDGVTVEVIRTPGHTHGSLSFYIREAEVLFLGDYDLTPFGPYYGDRASSISDTLASLELLRRIPAKVLITGHQEGIFENPDEVVWDRYRDVIFTRENKLLDLLSVPRTMEEIVNAHIVYGTTREANSWFEIGERILMKKHLEYLLEKKEIEVLDGRYLRL